MKRCLLLMITLLFFTSIPVNAIATNPLTDDLNYTAIIDGSEEIGNLQNTTILYTEEDICLREGIKENGVVIPVKIESPGSLYIRWSGKQYISKNCYMRVYYDRECTKQLGYDCKYFSKYTDYRIDCCIDFKEAGTYYIIISNIIDKTIYGTLNKNIITFKSYFYSGANAELLNDTPIAISRDLGISRYYKFVIPEDSNITLDSNNNLCGELLDEEKNVIYDYINFSSSNNRKINLYLDKGIFYFKTAGNYKLPSILKLNVYKLGDSEFTIKNKDTLTYSLPYIGSYIFVEYKSTKDGYISLSLDNNSCAYITLYNAKFKRLSKERYVHNNEVDFGVSKNKTYYIKFRCNYLSCDKLTTIKFGETAISDNSGNSKSKSTIVKKNRYFNGTISASNSDVKWYKIKVKNKNTITFNLNYKITGNLKLILYNKSGKQIMYKMLAGNDKVKFSKKLSKGIYYIKIQKCDRYSSGYYSLKYK